MRLEELSPYDPCKLAAMDDRTVDKLNLKRLVKRVEKLESIVNKILDQETPFSGISRD